jgi:hypothetical protein
MSNINLLKDKDVNYFIIYFYFALFFFSFLTTHVLFDKHVYFDHEVLWFFDELLYSYLVWSLFSLLNLTNISFKNKIKSYFTISIMVFITLISIYFIFSIGNIYKINFPEQFFSLYVNSVVFVIAIFLIFIYFTRTLLKNDLNKHNFILLNSYFFLIILFIAIIFIVINKPKHFLSFTLNYFPLLIMENLSFSFLFLFIPFLNFLFLFLIYFFKDRKIIPYLVISIIASWDKIFLLFYYTPSPYYSLQSFVYSLELNLLDNYLFLIILITLILLYIYMKRSHSPISTVVLFNIIIILLYNGLFLAPFRIVIIDFPVIPVPSYILVPVYELIGLINRIILFLIFVNLVIYLRARLTLKTLNEFK